MHRVFLSRSCDGTRGLSCDDGAPGGGVAWFGLGLECLGGLSVLVSFVGCDFLSVGIWLMSCLVSCQSRT